MMHRLKDPQQRKKFIGSLVAGILIVAGLAIVGYFVFFAVAMNNWANNK